MNLCTGNGGGEERYSDFPEGPNVFGTSQLVPNVNGTSQLVPNASQLVLDMEGAVGVGMDNGGRGTM